MKYLKSNEVKTIYGIPSGTISPLVDAFNDEDIEYIITRNEAGASFSATKYASITKDLGVCLIAGAVGLANGLNGIAEAMSSKSPVLVISGTVKLSQRNLGAIQGLDLSETLSHITKYSKTILRKEDVFNELHKAITIAKTPPYGPVHISIPLDIQLEEFNDDLPELAIGGCISNDVDGLDNIIEYINKVNTGIILVGSGCRGLGEEVKRLSRLTGFKTITTPNGKGVIKGDFELNLGNYGFAGSDLANEVVDSDYGECIIALGTSLGESSTRNYNKKLIEKRRLIHIDYDKDVLGRVFQEGLFCVSDLKYAIDYINRKIDRKEYEEERIEKINNDYVLDHTGLSLRLLVENITDILPKSTFYVSDIGESINYLYKYLKINEEADFESNLNYGCMGTGICGSIGVQKANPDMTVAAFVGDGSFFMNGFEVITAKEYNLPIIYFIINNAKYGYVDRGHQVLFGRSIDKFSHDRIDISTLCNNLGIESIQISDIDDLNKLKDKVTMRQKPLVVEVTVDGSEPVPIDRFKTLSK